MGPPGFDVVEMDGVITAYAGDNDVIDTYGAHAPEGLLDTLRSELESGVDLIMLMRFLLFVMVGYRRHMWLNATST